MQAGPLRLADEMARGLGAALVVWGKIVYLDIFPHCGIVVQCRQSNSVVQSMASGGAERSSHAGYKGVKYDTLESQKTQSSLSR